MDDNGTKYNRLDDKYHIFFQNINISLIPVDNFISDKKNTLIVILKELFYQDQEYRENT